LRLARSSGDDRVGDLPEELEGERLLLGVLYLALGAVTFALNNGAMRRGVVTGSVLQGMAMTVPIGGLTFLVMTIAFGQLGQLTVIPAMAFAWLAGQGIVHFVLSRYCNYKSHHQLMGVNLAAPVVQLQVPFAMICGGDAAREIHDAPAHRFDADAGGLLRHAEQDWQKQGEGSPPPIAGVPLQLD
jgi:drug/metabolite transporter (DMT)-like permease